MTEWSPVNHSILKPSFIDDSNPIKQKAHFLDRINGSKKCIGLHIGKHDYNTSYFMQDITSERIPIKNVSEEKDLGVIIDSELTFDSCVTTKINKANRNLGIINRLFIYMDKTMFLHIYKSLV